MDSIFENVFSEYTVTDVAIKPEGAEAYIDIDGAGSATEEYERKTITKAKSNVVVKKIARASGAGTLTLSLHMPYDLYNQLQGMLKGDAASVIAGVYALPGRVQIPNVEIAMKVEDEDGDKKLKYYPHAVSSAFSRSVTSEGDTVAEVEMTFDLSVDAYDQIMYEALAKELDEGKGELTSANWLTTVSSAKLQKVAGEG